MWGQRFEGGVLLAFVVYSPTGSIGHHSFPDCKASVVIALSISIVCQCTEILKDDLKALKVVKTEH